MVRHALIGTAAVVALVLTLFLINVASLLLLPPCPIEQIIPNKSEQDAVTERSNEGCPAPKGIVSAGFQEIGELLSPEAWTALAT